MSGRERNNVVEHGAPAGRPMLFAHGFGCDQTMWRHVWPAFADDHRVVLFDHVGYGGSDASAWDADRYASLQGYADDVLAICRELDLDDVVFVGHSVSAMIGVLAAAAEPERFGALVLVGPSPRYVDDDGYVGGFTREDVEGLLSSPDGLVERRGRALDAGLDGLAAEIAARRADPLPAIAGGVLSTLHDPRHTDDTCLLLARWAGSA